MGDFPIKVECLVNCEMVYKTESRRAIRGHHIFIITWFSVINEKFDCKSNDREEALNYDKHAFGVF